MAIVHDVRGRDGAGTSPSARSRPFPASNGRNTAVRPPARPEAPAAGRWPRPSPPGPDALRSFAVFDVHDPAELGADSPVTRRFPGYNNFNTYRLRDRGVGDGRPTGLLSRLAVRREGALSLGYIDSRFGTEIGIIGAGVRRLFLTASLRGSIALRAGPDREAVSAGSRGLVYRGLAGTRLLAGDGSRRVTVQLDEARLVRVLESLLDDACPECPAFAPEVDWAAPAAAPVARLMRHLFEEAGDPAGLFSVPAALETFTDTLAHLVLARLPHALSGRLLAPRSPAAPAQLRRAEAFMAAHADQAVALADVAAAAGCSTRALQLAFRRFRGTTPLAALREARLQGVRAALVAGVPGPATARRFGFSNATRFRLAYVRRFGEEPPGEGG